MCPNCNQTPLWNIGQRVYTYTYENDLLVFMTGLVSNYKFGGVVLEGSEYIFRSSALHATLRQAIVDSYPNHQNLDRAEAYETVRIQKLS